MAKRLFDLLVSATALTVLAIPFLAVAAMIKLTSPGPVFFLQRRIGQRGRPFRLFKFRTMRAEAGGPSVTADGDARITPVGRVLRRWKIDELPQFWNIFRGEMSVIGPRPEAERFAGPLRACRPVLDQRPGLASMAQLVYPHEAELLRNHPDPDAAYLEQLLPKKLAVDAEYESRRGFFSDLRLIGDLVLMILGWRSHVDTEFRFEPPLPAATEGAETVSHPVPPAQGPSRHAGDMASTPRQARA